MKKDCFKQEIVDAQKFRECAQCPLFEECTQSVYLKGAAGAERFGRGLGYLLGAGALVFAIANWGDLPHGVLWLILAAAVYLIAVYRSGAEYSGINKERLEHLARAADATPEDGGAAHAAAPAHH
jgi:hypothetical protein